MTAEVSKVTLGTTQSASNTMAIDKTVIKIFLILEIHSFLGACNISQLYSLNIKKLRNNS